MKNKIISILTFILLLPLASCDHWLEPASEVEPDRGTLLESPEGIEDAFRGIYASMSHKDLYGRALTYYIPSILAGHYGMTGTDIEHWMKYPYNDDYGECNEFAIIEIDRIWSSLYKLIANANSIIEYACAADPEEKDPRLCAAKGEALALRAFFHFELLRYFSEPYAMDPEARGIPYMTRMTQTAVDFLSIRAATEKILADLSHSLELSDGGADLGRLRFNRTAVLAVLARVHQFRGEASLARDYALQSIAGRPDYMDWHYPSAPEEDRLFESELIFALNVSRLEEYASGWVLPGGLGRKSTIMVITQAGEYYFDEPDDIRNSLWVTTVGYDRYCNKFDVTAETPLMPMIRLSEMAYIAAEGAASTEEAIEWLNRVRKARGMKPFAKDAPIDLQEEIAKEYRREFLCEGQLWHYYKRTMTTNIPGNSNFRGRIALYTFPIPEDERIFGSISDFQEK